MRKSITSLADLFRAVKPHCDRSADVIEVSYWALVHAVDGQGSWQYAAYCRLSRSFTPGWTEKRATDHAGYRAAMAADEKEHADACKRIERRLQQDGMLRLHRIASWDKCYRVQGTGRAWWTNGHTIFDEAILPAKMLAKLCRIRLETTITEENVSQISPSNSPTRFEYVGPCPWNDGMAAYISGCGTMAVPLNPDYSPPRTLWGSDELSPFVADAADPSRYIIMPMRAESGYLGAVQAMLKEQQEITPCKK